MPTRAPMPARPQPETIRSHAARKTRTSPGMLPGAELMMPHDSSFCEMYISRRCPVKTTTKDMSLISSAILIYVVHLPQYATDISADCLSFHQYVDFQKRCPSHASTLALHVIQHSRACMHKVPSKRDWGRCDVGC